ncbi:hypothetical protein [Stenotrophomonas sp. TWI1183]|uniref:hypothetical protein n=1 Tax=Stenotrophomonas sp. TWI1183 TaxID=3136799 RepID=UPI00320AB452
MTCRTSALNWIDVLYNSVSRTPGGLADAAAFLADRCGKTMHPETLRAKLRVLEGESVSIEIAELLTEWMREKAGGSETGASSNASRPSTSHLPRPLIILRRRPMLRLRHVLVLPPGVIVPQLVRRVALLLVVFFRSRRSRCSSHDMSSFDQ